MVGQLTTGMVLLVSIWKDPKNSEEKKGGGVHMCLNLCHQLCCNCTRICPRHHVFRFGAITDKKRAPPGQNVYVQTIFRSFRTFTLLFSTKRIESTTLVVVAAAFGVAVARTKTAAPSAAAILGGFFLSLLS